MVMVDKKNIIYRNYKEPLIPLPSKYFGFEGVILERIDDGALQCHICGEWHRHLPNHIRAKHNDLFEGAESVVKAYKNYFGIMQKTALIANDIREKYIENGCNLKYWTKEKRKAWVEKMRTKKKNNYNNNAIAEKKNEKGLCFIQLLELIKKKAIKLGKTPSINDVKGYQGQSLSSTIRRTYGDYKTALALCKLTPNNRGGYGKNRKNELSKEFLLQCLIDFKNYNNRSPFPSDCNNEYLPDILIYNKKFGSLTKARKIAKLST